MGYLRGASPLSIDFLPLPLIKGKGIKGIGLPNRNLNGDEVSHRLESEHPGGKLGELHYVAGDNTKEQNAEAGESQRHP